jgi:hypothetical protein
MNRKFLLITVRGISKCNETMPQQQQNISQTQSRSLNFTLGSGQRVPLSVHNESAPVLFKELGEGTKITINLEHAKKQNSIYTVQLRSSEGLVSNPVSVLEKDLSNLAPALEFEARRLKGIRENPEMEDTFRAKSARLPGIVIAKGSVYASTSTELGNYYCEAMMFSPQYMAEYEPGCSILKNRNEEPLNGFMHIPGDKYFRTNVTPTPDYLISRHAENSKMVGSGILGYLSQALEVNPQLENFKVLIAGYHGHVPNNPSGEFARSVEPIGKALEHAFGDQLKKIEVNSMGPPIRLTSQIELQGKPVTVEVVGQSFPVNPSSVDYGRTSVQSLIRQEKPHSVIGMGVFNHYDPGESFFEVGRQADTGLIMKEPQLKEVFKVSSGLILPANYSLPEAIYAGHHLIERREKQTPQ